MGNEKSASGDSSNAILLCLGVFVLIAFLGNDGGHDHADLEKQVSKLEKQLVEVSRDQQAILAFQARSDLEEAMALLSHEERRIKTVGLDEIEDLVRRFPEELAPEARHGIAEYIRGRLESGGATEDEDVRLALTSLFGLEGRQVRSKTVGSGAEVSIGYEVDFSGLDFRGYDFSKLVIFGFSFEQADLRGARLALATFNDCSFSGANLQGADLGASAFFDADFAGADLTNASLSGANFVGASFLGSILTATELQGAKFDRADLSNVQGLTREQLVEVCFHVSTELGEYSSWYSTPPDFCPSHFRAR